MEQELKQVETALADAGLYIENPERFNDLTARHKEITTEIAFAENQWLELQMLKDELEK